MPHRSSVPIIWRKNNILTASKCKNCGALFILKKNICPKCFSNYLENIKLSGKGTIITFTKIYTPPSGFENQTPYYMAIIELEEGLKITAQIDTDSIKIGDKVKAVFRKINQDSNSGLIEYGFKFEIEK